MSNEFQGTSGSVSDQRFAIIVSTYHESITSKLKDGAEKTLLRNEVPADQIDILWVPGAWEIPTATQMALQTSRYQAVITLGCVIRGETTHDQHINTTVSQSLGQLSLEFRVPVAFGVLTCNSMDQAIARSGGEVGNKGVEAAEAAIHMLLLQKELLS